MFDPLDDRRRQLMGLMENSIAPLPEAPQFQPMQPMELAPIQDQPSQLGRGVDSLGQLGAQFMNRRKPLGASKPMVGGGIHEAGHMGRPSLINRSGGFGQGFML